MSDNYYQHNIAHQLFQDNLDNIKRQTKNKTKYSLSTLEVSESWKIDQESTFSTRND